MMDFIKFISVKMFLNDIIFRVKLIFSFDPDKWIPKPQKIEAREHLRRQKLPKMLALKRGSIYLITDPNTSKLCIYLSKHSN
jgi:hypothetical protein